MSKAWYILTVQSNHELKAKEEIEYKLLSEGSPFDIEEVFVPIKEYVVIENGKKKNVQERIYKGYVFIHADMTDELYVNLKSCTKVQKIMGDSGKATRIPFKDIEKIKLEVSASKDNPKEKNLFDLDDLVRINSGPFEGFEGRVMSNTDKRGDIKIEILVFGKSTPVSIGLKSITKVS